MPKAIFIVESSPADGREAEFNEWYTNIHLAEVLKVPGFVGAWRLKRTVTNPAEHSYATMYEIDADEPRASLAELGRRQASGEINLPTELLSDRPPRAALYDMLG